MKIAMKEAKARLTELVRRAEQGEEVVLTRHGQPVARVIAERRPVDVERRRVAIARIQESARKKVRPGPSAARAADYLYGDDGLPA